MGWTRSRSVWHCSMLDCSIGEFLFRPQRKKTEKLIFSKKETHPFFFNGHVMLAYLKGSFISLLLWTIFSLCVAPCSALMMKCKRHASSVIALNVGMGILFMFAATMIVFGVECISLDYSDGMMKKACGSGERAGGLAMVSLGTILASFFCCIYICCLCKIR